MYFHPGNLLKYLPLSSFFLSFNLLYVLDARRGEYLFFPRRKRRREIQRKERILIQDPYSRKKLFQFTITNPRQYPLLREDHFR